MLILRHLHNNSRTGLAKHSTREKQRFYATADRFAIPRLLENDFRSLTIRTILPGRSAHVHHHGVNREKPMSPNCHGMIVMVWYRHVMELPHALLFPHNPTRQFNV